MTPNPKNNLALRVRNETLVALRMIYPAALQADLLLRSLLALFPTLEWSAFKRDLCYLAEKGYIQRVVADSEGDPKFTDWPKRWFKVTAKGLEIAESALIDPALNNTTQNGATANPEL
jgi:hypothetical protein